MSQQFPKGLRGATTSIADCGEDLLQRVVTTRIAGGATVDLGGCPVKPVRQTSRCVTARDLAHLAYPTPTFSERRPEAATDWAGRCGIDICHSSSNFSSTPSA